MAGGRKSGVGLMETGNERWNGADAAGEKVRARANPHVIEVLQLVADWEAARADLMTALRQRATALRQADLSLRKARCGLDQPTWEALLAGRPGRPLLRSPRNSQTVFRALRARKAIEEAEAHQVEVEARTRAATDAAWASFRETTREVIDSGHRADAITGLPGMTLVRIVRNQADPEEPAFKTLIRDIRAPKWKVQP